MGTGSIPQEGASGVSPRFLRALPIFKEIVPRDVFSFCRRVWTDLGLIRAAAGF
jgi:hypothetical protein